MSRDRVKSLKRIEAVQKQLVALADLRLVSAERLYRDIESEKTRLCEFIGQEDALGPSLATAALRMTNILDQRLARAQNLRDRQKDQRNLAKCREHAATALVQTESAIARRQIEDRDLAETMEAWLSREGASLP